MKISTQILLLIAFGLFYSTEVQAQKTRQNKNLLQFEIQDLFKNHVFGMETHYFSALVEKPGNPGWIRDSMFLKKELNKLDYLQGASGEIKVVKLLKAPEAPGWIRDSMFLAVIKTPKAISKKDRSSFDALKGFDKTSPIKHFINMGDLISKAQIKGRESGYAIVPMTRTTEGIKVCACTGGSNGDPPTRY